MELLTKESTIPSDERVLVEAGLGSITTEVLDAPAFYYAEEYHQQYLAKNPWGYCGLGGTGMPYPVAAAQGSSAPQFDA